MATKAQKVRLSVFLIISGTILLTFFVVLAGSRLLKRMDWYVIEYKDISVTGLEPGAAVKYQGVPVGRVTALSLKDAATVLVEIEVERGTPIKENSEAILTMVGITGLKFVEIIGGTEDSDILEVGGTIVAGESVFETISGRAEVILAKLEQVLNNLNIMLSPKSTESLQNVLASINDMSEQVNLLLTDNREHITNSITHLDTLMGRHSVQRTTRAKPEPEVNKKGTAICINTTRRTRNTLIAPSGPTTMIRAIGGAWRRIILRRNEI